MARRRVRIRTRRIGRRMILKTVVIRPRRRRRKSRGLLGLGFLGL